MACMNIVYMLKGRKHHSSSQEPVKVVLGKEMKPKGTGANHRVVEVEECMVYVPILKTLEFLFRSDLVRDEVLMTY